MSQNEAFKQFRISDESKAKLVALRIEKFDEDVDAISKSLHTGRITLNMWQEEFKLLLRQLHTGATAIGKGGWSSVTPQDWGRSGPILKEQYRFLQGFAEDIFARRETISLAAIQARAHLYGEKAGFTANLAQAGTIAQQLPWIPRDGTTICLNRCMCHWKLSELSRKGGTKTIQATWTLSPVENCETCIGRDGFIMEATVNEEEHVPPFIGGVQRR